MKQKEIKVLVAIIAIVLVVGAIVIFTKGLAFDLMYRDSKSVELNLGKEFSEKDLRDITNVVFGDQEVIIEPIEVYRDAVSITTTEITDEQKVDLVNKVNEKYELELSADSVVVEVVPNVRGRDIIKPYVVPFVVVTLIILGYFVVRFGKLNLLEVLIQAVGVVALAQLVLLAVMAIARVPVGVFSIPVILVVYLFSIFACTCKFERDLEKVLEKNEN